MADQSQAKAIGKNFSPDHEWEILTRLLNKNLTTEEIEEAHDIALKLSQWADNGGSQPERIAYHVGRRAFREIMRALVSHIENKLDVERS